MSMKRKRESPPTKTRKNLSNRKKRASQIVPKKNKYDALGDDSDGEKVFDFSKQPDIVLLDSDKESDGGHDSEVVVNSDQGDQESVVIVTTDEEAEEPPNEPQEPNGLAANHDFIEFGFSSSEEERGESEGEFSDDGVISNDETLVQPHTATSSYPWVKAHDHSKQKEIADWLTMEMKDFVSYISPSREEIIIRNKVIQTLKETIKDFWPTTETHVFGSSATDLYLPGSDVDMVVISRSGDYEHRSRLYQLSSHLRGKKLAKNIEVITGAKVPIIKFVDPESSLHIDVSFERTNGIEAARRIRKWLETTPGLRELVLVVKQFLRSRRLNNVHVGGLGGYATIILCYHFLRLHPRIATDNMMIMDNLGSLLIEFFELYGRNFSYDNLVIAIDPQTDVPTYLRKSECRELAAGKNPFAIVVQDPADPLNNITRSSYNLRDIKKGFGGAYQLLTDKCYQLNAASYKGRIGQAILGDIIKYKGKERDFNDDRDKVQNTALVSHETDEESDGAEGNDKYYFSDITVESEDETFAEKKTVSEPEAVKRKVSDFIDIKDGSEEDEEEEPAAKKQKVLDKQIKREYWTQKGLEF